MIEARRRLIGSARDLFQGQLLGIRSWDKVAHDNPVASDPLPNGRRNPIKFKEVAVMRFDDFVLTVSSPEEAPPLGRVTLSKGANLLVNGTLDSAVWTRVAAAIRESGNG